MYYGLDAGNFGYGNLMTDRDLGSQSNKKVDVYLEFKNDKAYGLGVPLPAGRMRVSKLDSADSSLEFIGEDIIDHTPKDEQVRIKLGSAFDVVGERRQVDFSVDSKARWMEEEIEVKLRNHKDEPVEVIVKENLYRWTNWKVISKTQPYTKEDARTIHFPGQGGEGWGDRRALSGAVYLVILRMAATLAACAWFGAGLPHVAAGAEAGSAYTRELVADGVEVSVDLDSPAFSKGPDVIVDWIRRSVEIVGAYYGKFPVPRLRIHVQAAEGHGVKTGSAFGNRGGSIRVVVGREASEAELRGDWILVHEMTHLALPDVGERHVWLSEGLATYVEGIARAQSENRTQEDVWAEQVRSMPKGLPQSGDAGLDRTHTWGRTYWGGALFCLVADVEIRRRTENRRGLQDALRAIARASGGLVADWPVERVIAVGDAATGTSVLGEQYAQWKNAPVQPDLPALWSRLGIEPQGASVRLRDDAPLAATRRAIMTRP